LCFLDTDPISIAGAALPGHYWNNVRSKQSDMAR
jgi:hypothetical protein